MQQYLSEDTIKDKVFEIRGLKVMIDRDLAKMYDVQTRRLKEQVRRNINRFPPDFMFELTKDELENWRSQIATSNQDAMGLRHKPYAFTEKGIAMLSSVLNSEKAIQINITIMRVFDKVRKLAWYYGSFKEEIDLIKKEYGNKLDKHTELLDYLINSEKSTNIKKEEIGFKHKSGAGSQ